jgi:hypothetical protein
MSAHKKPPRRLREREGQSKPIPVTISPPTTRSKAFSAACMALEGSLSSESNRLAEPVCGSHVLPEFLRAAFHEIRRLNRERQRILCAAGTCRHGLEAA